MSEQSDGGQLSPDTPAVAPKRPSRKWLWLTILIVVLLAVVAGALVYFRHDNSERKASAPAKPKTEYQKLKDNNEKLERSGDFKTEAQKIEAYLATNPSQEEKKKLTFTLASTYLNANQPEKALEVYKRLLDYGDQYAADSYHGQAYAYQQLNDKPNAIIAYKKAIEAMESSHDPLVANRVEADRSSIKSLGGTP